MAARPSRRRRPPSIATGLAALAAAGAVLAAALWPVLGPAPRGLALAGVAALTASAGAVGWFDRRLRRPLAELAAGVERRAAGEAAAPFAAPREPSLAALARALDRAAARHDAELAALGAERDHYRSILAGISQGVLITDRRGRAVFANPAFRRLFGVRGEVAGRGLPEVARLPLLDRLVEEALATGEPRRGELAIGPAPRRVLGLTVSRLAPDGGAVLVAEDVSEGVRLGEVRRDLVANVSHELKNPLAAIRGYAETLAAGALAEPPTARAFLARILRQCDRLQALLEDLLILSRLESPQAVADRRPVDLERVVRRTVEMLAAAAARREVAVEVVAAPLPPLAGEPQALERLAVNLLDNAIKYNRRGGRVTVRLARGDGGVVLEVQDTGLGIPPEALPRVFERFFRVDRGRARDEGGTGLGLAIVKHAAQIHGGRVEAASEMGRGSTFRVTLPLD